MKKTRLILALLFASATFTACTSSPVAPDGCDETVEDCTKPTSGS